MTSVWVVFGCCNDAGNGPGFLTKWEVATYTTREQAEDHFARLVSATKVVNRSRAAAADRRQARRRAKELDPAWVSWADYGMREIKLFRHLDEYLENI